MLEPNFEKADGLGINQIPMIVSVKKCNFYSQAEKFKLHIGTYSGSAGNSLNYHNNMKFSTPDQDNDKHNSYDCAGERGAWWHKTCTQSNLNGLNYGPSESVKSWAGICWQEFGGGSISLKSVQMAIRPMN